MVESSGLLNRRTVKSCTEGSNPSLSAILHFIRTSSGASKARYGLVALQAGSVQQTTEGKTRSTRQVRVSRNHLCVIDYGDQGDASKDVPHQGRQNIGAQDLMPGRLAQPTQKHHLDRPGHYVGESAQPD